MKKFLILSALLLASLSALAQEYTGGVKGTVVSRVGRTPIPGAQLVLTRVGFNTVTAVADEEGRFLVENLANGVYAMKVTADEYADINVNVTVDKGFVKDLIFVSMSPEQQIHDVDASNFSEFDMDDSGYSDTPTILFSSNDVYNNVVGFGFSAIRFKNRGYNSENQDVYLSGVRLNDAITGYSPYSLWTGLNEVMRTKESTTGLETFNYGPGGYNGGVNILANPSSVRKGWRGSVLTNSASYRLRLMMTYASGPQDNGWSYAFSASARLGGNDWIKGVYYRSFAYYLGVEKAFDNAHRLTLFHFATPGERGAQNASTQEVYTMMGDNMYNSNWGYQDGKVRNSRVRKTFEPVTVLKYEYAPGTDFESTTTFLWRTGRNGYTALDWYDAPNPRPDYYRNLPSYAERSFEQEEYSSISIEKAQWLRETWTTHIPDYVNYQHINWDRLYNVNYNSEDGRSKYAQEERHVDQNDFNLAQNFLWRPGDEITLNGGVNLKWNRTENYKKIADLLGGSYYLNIDSFAERDFAISDAKVQNDLDYWMAHGEAQKVKAGDKYGYDYYANVRKADLWMNLTWQPGAFKASVSGKAGYEDFWREGMMRKGMFAGLNDQGGDFVVNGVNLTTRDSKGNVVTSKGKSEVCKFFTYRALLGLEYVLGGTSRFYGNVGYFTDAPTFNEAFISPRTRNTVMDGLTTKKTFSSDINYQFSSHGYNLRVTGFYTTIKDMSDVMSFYDDSQNSFTNFAMTGIDQRHMGVELGAQMPLPISGLTVSGVLSLGEYIYTSTPHMVQTVDNSAQTIREADVTWWKQTPIYRMIGNQYDQDLEGNYVITGYKKHYVPSSPQLASEIALNYRTRSYWFFEVNGQYFAHSYLDMNPLYRTDFACAGPDGVATAAEIVKMTSQEEFDPYFLLNASIGKSWFLRGRKGQVGFSLNASNILNNKNVKTGGYEQTRVYADSEKTCYNGYDSKYFYMQGFNYMMNIYFRF